MNHRLCVIVSDEMRVTHIRPFGTRLSYSSLRSLWPLKHQHHHDMNYRHDTQILYLPCVCVLLLSLLWFLEGRHVLQTPKTKRASFFFLSLWHDIMMINHEDWCTRWLWLDSIIWPTVSVDVTVLTFSPDLPVGPLAPLPPRAPYKHTHTHIRFTVWDWFDTCMMVLTKHSHSDPSDRRSLQDLVDPEINIQSILTYSCFRQQSEMLL